MRDRHRTGILEDEETGRCMVYGEPVRSEEGTYLFPGAISRSLGSPLRREVKFWYTPTGQTIVEGSLNEFEAYSVGIAMIDLITGCSLFEKLNKLPEKEVPSALLDKLARASAIRSLLFDSHRRDIFQHSALPYKLQDKLCVLCTDGLIRKVTITGNVNGTFYRPARVSVRFKQFTDAGTVMRTATVSGYVTLRPIHIEIPAYPGKLPDQAPDLWFIAWGENRRYVSNKFGEQLLLERQALLPDTQKEQLTPGYWL